VNVSKEKDSAKHLCCGVETIPFEFSAREGCKAVLWGTDEQSAVLLFGGRKGPSKPLGELLLFDDKSRTFLQPLDIRGTAPAARWGHSLTSLPGGDMVFLCGGRNETATFSDCFVLSCRHDGQSKYFQWTHVETYLDSTPQPRFHHSASVLRDGEILIMGGLSSANHVLGCDENSIEDNAVQLVQVQSPSDHKWQNVVNDTKTTPLFGHATSALGPHGLVFGFGGLPVMSDGDHDDMPIQCFSVQNKQGKTILVPQEVNISGAGDFGGLVHHNCVELPEKDEHGQRQMALIGGGVQGFAFGPQFASSMVLTVQVSQDDTLTEGSPVNRPANVHAIPATTSAVAAASSEPFVAYVLKRHAHKLRSCLEQEGFLDKRFRMIPASADEDDARLDNPQDYIAVPISETAHGMFGDAKDPPSFEWWTLIHAVGRRSMPLSTANYAAAKRN